MKLSIYMLLSIAVLSLCIWSFFFFFLNDQLNEEETSAVVVVGGIIIFACRLVYRAVHRGREKLSHE